jgi:hypothetical protein
VAAILVIGLIAVGGCSSSGRSTTSTAALLNPLIGHTASQPPPHHVGSEGPSVLREASSGEWPDGWDHRHRDATGGGPTPWGTRWELWLFERDRGVAVGIRLGQRLFVGCCLGRVHLGLRPLGYVVGEDSWAVLISHVSNSVEAVRVHCQGCTRRSTIPRIIAGRLSGVPQIAVTFVRPDNGRSSVVTLMANRDRDVVVLPSCGDGCATGFDWGALGIAWSSR